MSLGHHRCGCSREFVAQSYGGHGRRQRDPPPRSSPRPAWLCWRRRAAARRGVTWRSSARLQRGAARPHQERRQSRTERLPSPAACARTGWRPTPTPAATDCSRRRPRSNSGSAPPRSRRPRAPGIDLVPNGGQPTPAQVAHYRNVMLVYARCLRAHGVSEDARPRQPRAPRHRAGHRRRREQRSVPGGLSSLQERAAAVTTKRDGSR